MPHFKIHDVRDSSKIIYEGEAESLKDLVCIAVESGKSLNYSNLSNCDLSGITIRGGSFVDSTFDRSRFVDSRFVGCTFVGSTFDGSRFDERTLAPFKADLFMKLLYAQHEAAGLRKALIEGRVNGQAYEGECGCFVGTIENLRREAGCEVVQVIKRDSSSPIEIWFMLINKGDTPATNQISKMVVEWVEEFMTLLNIKFE